MSEKYQHDLQTLCVLPRSGKEDDWQLWSTKFQEHRTAGGYGDIIEEKVPVPSMDDVAKTTDKQDFQQVEILLKANKAGYMDLVISMNGMKSFNLVK